MSRRTAKSLVSLALTLFFASSVFAHGAYTKAHVADRIARWKKVWASFAIGRKSAGTTVKKTPTLATHFVAASVSPCLSRLPVLPFRVG